MSSSLDACHCSCVCSKHSPLPLFRSLSLSSASPACSLADICLWLSRCSPILISRKANLVPAPYRGQDENQWKLALCRKTAVWSILLLTDFSFFTLPAPLALSPWWWALLLQPGNITWLPEKLALMAPGTSALSSNITEKLWSVEWQLESGSVHTEQQASAADLSLQSRSVSKSMWKGLRATG